MKLLKCKVNVKPENLEYVRRLAMFYVSPNYPNLSINFVQANKIPRHGYNYTFKIPADKVNEFADKVAELWGYSLDLNHLPGTLRA